MDTRVHAVAATAGVSPEEAQEKLDAGLVYDATGPVPEWRPADAPPSPSRWDEHAAAVRATYAPAQ